MDGVKYIGLDVHRDTISAAGNCARKKHRFFGRLRAALRMTPRWGRQALV